MLALDPKYPNKAAMWQDILKMAMNSPLSNRAWCKQEGIDYQQFRSWKRYAVRQKILPIPEAWSVGSTIEIADKGNLNYVKLQAEWLKISTYLVLRPIRRNLSIDSMVCQIQFGLGLDPRSGEQFMLISTDRTQLFILTFHKDGFLLRCKRREQGKFYWPSRIEADGTTNLKASQGAFLMEGLTDFSAQKPGQKNVKTHRKIHENH